jgi:hypothetical protein
LIQRPRDRPYGGATSPGVTKDAITVVAMVPGTSPAGFIAKAHGGGEAALS